MSHRPEPTQTFHRRAEGDDSSTMASASPQFVPLRLRSEIGREFVEIDQPSAIVGRHSDADVRLSAPDISRRHCRLFFDGGVWKVQDLSSLNGVFVNDDATRLSPLYQGDRLRLGTTTFVVERAAAPRNLKGRVKNETLRSIAKAME